MLAEQTLCTASHRVAQELLVQRLPACLPRNRHHEVTPCIANQVLLLALVVVLRRPAELLGEQVVVLQLREGPCLLSLAVADLLIGTVFPDPSLTQFFQNNWFRTRRRLHFNDSMLSLESSPQLQNRRRGTRNQR